MFCPNCRLERPEDTEYCSECGVKLEYKVNALNQYIQCPYCGHYTKGSKCKNCSHQINKLNNSTIVSGIIGFVHAVPGELKSYEFDGTFVKTNLVMIVAIMGTAVILLLYIS